MDIMETVDQILQGNLDIKELRKNFERVAIKTFCVPPIKGKRREIVSEYDEKIAMVAATTKTAIMAVSYQMDETIKGKGQKSVKEAVEKQLTKFEDI